MSKVNLNLDLGEFIKDNAWFVECFENDDLTLTQEGCTATWLWKYINKDKALRLKLQQILKEYYNE